ncbi:MAG TPA: N-acetyltransferase family protein [Gammaproteobacteria bacterium]|nr:N-acetyltransferase family protein [Gammaproteobacteria bacterium]
MRQINKTVQIRELVWSDFSFIQLIYQHGIDTGNATFQGQTKDWENWDRTYLPHCRLVAEYDRHVVGWAALSAVSSRCVYGGVAEVSIYIEATERGKRFGSALLQGLIACSERCGFWTLQAGIFPENKASLALHEKCGFKVVGIREKLGQLLGVWRDVVLMERRSLTIGIPARAS